MRMRKARQSGIERLEKYLVKVILEKGADRNQPFSMVLLLGFLKALSYIFAAVVAVRYLFYRIGLLRRYPLGIQVVSIGNVTAGGQPVPKHCLATRRLLFILKMKN